MKECYRCKVTQPKENFYKKSQSKDGLATYCKTCCKAEQKRYKARPQVSKEDVAKYVRELVEAGSLFTCGVCGEEKVATEFYTKRDNGTVKLSTSRCKRCQCDYQRNKRFNITTEDFDRMLSEQGGRCKICKISHEDYQAAKGKVFAVDHCHKTGKVRGLLCCNCNKGLGHFFDRPDLLSTALEYITKEGDIV